MIREAQILDKAKAYAFLLLKFRPRSEYEITQRLKRKKFDDKVIKEVVSFLKEKSFIDDNYFARAWIDSRLKRPLGLRRIRNELKIKGIADGVIDSQIREAKSDYSEKDIVVNLLRDKLERLKGIEPEKAKRRIYAFLIRRGFSPDVIIEALTKLT